MTLMRLIHSHFVFIEQFVRIENMDRLHSQKSAVLSYLSKALLCVVLRTNLRACSSPSECSSFVFIEGFVMRVFENELAGLFKFIC